MKEKPAAQLLDLKTETGQQTAIACIPLYVRAKENRSKTPVLQDPKASEMLRCLDLDTTVLERSPLTDYAILTRTVIMDHAVKNFMKQRDGIIVNLGPGFDTRLARLDNGKIRWYEVDVPEMIAFRRQFFTESDRVRFLAKTVWDGSWIKEIELPRETSVLIIAEGWPSFFDAERMGQLLGLLAVHFPGAQMCFDVVQRRLIGKENGSPFKWGLDKARDIERIHRRVHLVEHWTIREFQSPRRRLWFYLLTLLHPAAKKQMEILRVQF